MRKIEVPTDTPTEFELGDTAADIQRRREKREARERGTETGRSEVEGGKKNGGNYTLCRGGSGRIACKTNRSDTEMDTEGGGEADTSQSESRHKEGHMTNIYLIDLDEEAIVDLVKDLKDL